MHCTALPQALHCRRRAASLFVRIAVPLSYGYQPSCVLPLLALVQANAVQYHEIDITRPLRTQLAGTAACTACMRGGASNLQP